MDELVLYDDPDLITKTKAFTAPRHEVGVPLERDYWLHNESNDWPIDSIRFENTDRDLVITYPKRIDAGGISKVTIRFTPPIVRRDPLNEPTVYEGVLLIG